jgi:imidazolonepropionase-like amidohydrolase
VSGDTHKLYELRFHAGNAIANGLSVDDALAAVTANVAQAFNLDSGTIAVGKTADLVLWSADPFELSTQVSQMWINGEEYSTISRQDALRDRYTTSSDMPRSYVK